MPAPAATQGIFDEIDELTLRRARDGEEPATRALVECYQGRVYAVLYRMAEPALGRARVEELTQETFVRVFSALQRFEIAGPARMSTWILTIATRLALKELRRRRDIVPMERIEAVAPDRPDAVVSRRQLGVAIRAAVAALAPGFRAAFVLREYHGLDYGEIAQALDVDPGTVKSRLSRARAELRRMLQGVRDE